MPGRKVAVTKLVRTHNRERIPDHLAIILTYNQSFDYIFHLKTNFLNSNLKKKTHPTYPTQPNCHRPIDIGTGTLRPFGRSVSTVVQFRGSGTLPNSASILSQFFLTPRGPPSPQIAEYFLFHCELGYGV